MSPEAWIALIGVLGTLFDTLFSAYLTSRAAAQREERQWQRQKRENRRREILDTCETFTELALLCSIGKPQGDEVFVRA